MFAGAGPQWNDLRPGRWVWIALALSTACAIVSCQRARIIPPSTPVPAATPPSIGTLAITVQPAGATILVDGQQQGSTPLVLQLPPRPYLVRVESPGYAALERTVRVQAAEQTEMGGRLLDTAPPIVSLNLPTQAEAGQEVSIRTTAADNEPGITLTLLIDGTPVTTATDTMTYRWNTAALTGRHEVRVKAIDRSGNIGEAVQSIEIQAAPPTPRPSPTASVAAMSDLAMRETTLTIPTYPYDKYLHVVRDEIHGFSVLALDRAQYEQSAPRTAPRQYKAVVLENRYLRLVFLPELGGRLYSCVYKPTGQELFYHNPVCKPSYWGPLERDKNWWLAIGGMEWAFPVQEHGYEWGVPWKYQVSRAADGLTMILHDAGSKGLQVEVRVTLPSERSYLVVRPRIVNHTTAPWRLQFWVNAALTLGSSSTSPNTEFIYPTSQMIVHSTGDTSLPGERQWMDWPLYAGRDLAQYRNWDNWLGVFVPRATGNFCGAYNHDTGLGVARTAPSASVPGAKLFAFGARFPSRDEFTDDGSDYFELWGGPCRTFWPEDDALIPPKGVLEWSETWLPFAGIGGLDAATRDVVCKTTIEGTTGRVGIASGMPQKLRLTVELGRVKLLEQQILVTPEKPAYVEFRLPTAPSPLSILRVQAEGDTGQVLSYEKSILAH